MITFSHSNVVSYLLKFRHVYTIRKSKRPTGRQRLYIKGERKTSWNTYCTVERVVTATNNTMEQFYKESGFNSWQEWQQAAEALFNRTIGASDDFSIFKVQLIETPLPTLGGSCQNHQSQTNGSKRS